MEGQKEELCYLSGFGNEFSSEALPGALPVGMNSPQKCKYDLYAEQISGTAFTMPRGQNLRSWLYRMSPSVVHDPFEVIDVGNIVSDFSSIPGDPNQLRWDPMPYPSEEKVNFIEGMTTIAGSGDASMKTGVAIHMYAANASMDNTAMYNSDGDYLIVPQCGRLMIKTEFGHLDVNLQEICIIPRGIKFSVKLCGPSRGYILETFRNHFTLPNLGPIGANGLANPRDFMFPTARYDDPRITSVAPHTLINKFCGRLYRARLPRGSPFDVVAWAGNYAPFKYDLSRYCAVNTVSFDHPDPSIFTVLTCPSEIPGEAAADFVIFPPRWMVAEGTFRPPYFHRNGMSEFMGMIHGTYDAKKGFRPAGASLHTCMTPHGPDADTVQEAWKNELGPVKFEGGLAFMFETSAILKATPAALGAAWRDRDYALCWRALPRLFHAPTTNGSGCVDGGVSGGICAKDYSNGSCKADSGGGRDGDGEGAGGGECDEGIVAAPAVDSPLPASFASSPPPPPPPRA